MILIIHVCINHPQVKHLFARGSKTQTHVRTLGVKTSHRQFPNFENQGSEDTDVAENQRSKGNIQIYMMHMKRTETMTPKTGAVGDT